MVLFMYSKASKRQPLGGAGTDCADWVFSGVFFVSQDPLLQKQWPNSDRLVGPPPPESEGFPLADGPRNRNMPSVPGRVGNGPIPLISLLVKRLLFFFQELLVDFREAFQRHKQNLFKRYFRKDFQKLSNQNELQKISTSNTSRTAQNTTHKDTLSTPPQQVFFCF